MSEKKRRSAPADEQLLEWPHTEGVDPWNLFLRSYKTVIAGIDRDLKAATGLTLSQYELIINVQVLGGRARPVDIARRTLLSQSRISRQIDALQQLGYIVRESNEAQPRATYAVLTPAGSKMFDEALQPFLRTYFRHFLDLLDPQDVADLARVNAKLVAQGKGQGAAGKRRNGPEPRRDGSSPLPARKVSKPTRIQSR